MPRANHVPVPREVEALFRLGAALHGLPLREYMSAVVAEYVRAANDHLLTEPLRLLPDGEFRSTPLPVKGAVSRPRK